MDAGGRPKMQTNRPLTFSWRPRVSGAVSVAPQAETIGTTRPSFACDTRARRSQIGCGSGLFRLAARRLGARVESFDYDPQSVACARERPRTRKPWQTRLLLRLSAMRYGRSP